MSVHAGARAGAEVPAAGEDLTRDAASPLPRVYVVVINWRGWADTLECLESVFRQHYGNFRVIVCDNDSGDDSLDRIRTWAAGTLPSPDTRGSSLSRLSSPPVAKPIEVESYDRVAAEHGGVREAPEAPLVLIQTGQNLGFAGGNNVGIRYALARGDADYIWLLNNDTVVDPDALGAMVECAERNRDVGMVGSKLLFYDQPDVVQAIGARLTRWRGTATLMGSGTRDDGRWSDPIDVDCILGASLLVRKETLGEIGLLDERYFMYAEELDWCWRAGLRGWRRVYAPASVVWHKVGRSAGEKSPFQEYHSTRSTLLFVQKHFPRYLPLAMAYGIYRVLLPKIVRVQPARGLAVLRGFRDFFRAMRAATP